jgi:hypothetical protein
MKLLENMDEMMQFIEWQHGGERTLEIGFLHEKEGISYHLIDVPSKQEQRVKDFSEITVFLKHANPIKKSEVDKAVRQFNISLYSFLQWKKEGKRDVKYRFLPNGETEVYVYDYDLEIGQTVQFAELIDLYSEKVLALMQKCIELKESDPKRKTLLTEIAKLEMKKVTK